MSPFPTWTKLSLKNLGLDTRAPGSPSPTGMLPHFSGLQFHPLWYKRVIPLKGLFGLRTSMMLMKQEGNHSCSGVPSALFSLTEIYQISLSSPVMQRSSFLPLCSPSALPLKASHWRVYHGIGYGSIYSICLLYGTTSPWTAGIAPHSSLCLWPCPQNLSPQLPRNDC